jgi:isopentenyldiphosphate isomerase
MLKTTALRSIVQLQQSYVQSSARMQLFQRRVNACSHVPSATIPFHIQGMKVGEVFEDTARMLCNYDDVFTFTSTGALGLVDRLNDADDKERSTAIAGVTMSLKSEGVVQGWRNELISVAVSDIHTETLFRIERAAYPLLGVVGYGVHVNGYVTDMNAIGGKKLWIGTRSKTKQTYPGMRDHIVAGQISEGLTPSQTVIKECEEEAGIPEHMALNARPVGCISYRGCFEKGWLKRDVLFCYDLELDSDFVPTPMDGEVECFELLDLEEVCNLIEGDGSTTTFKPNCVLVLIDFLIRTGYISADSPGYFDLTSSLRKCL